MSQRVCEVLCLYVCLSVCLCKQVFRWVPVPPLWSRRSRHWVVPRRRTSPASPRPRGPGSLAEDGRPVTATPGLAGHGLHQPRQCRVRLHASASRTQRLEVWRQSKRWGLTLCYHHDIMLSSVSSSLCLFPVELIKPRERIVIMWFSSCVLVLVLTIFHFKTNRRAIAMMFVRLSGTGRRACIVIIRCTLA